MEIPEKMCVNTCHNGMEGYPFVNYTQCIFSIHGYGTPTKPGAHHILKAAVNYIYFFFFEYIL